MANVASVAPPVGSWVWACWSDRRAAPASDPKLSEFADTVSATAAEGPDATAVVRRSSPGRPVRLGAGAPGPGPAYRVTRGVEPDLRPRRHATGGCPVLRR